MRRASARIDECPGSWRPFGSDEQPMRRVSAVPRSSIRAARPEENTPKRTCSPTPCAIERGNATAVLALALELFGCSKETSTKPDAPGSPEAVYRQFMLANLEGTEDTDGAELLWEGPPRLSQRSIGRWRSFV